jgi:pimeloyl-ACP methyl ester carboxylesterase/mannose-6-phosphate isomerase-like protein (cupin superfamily)
MTTATRTVTVDGLGGVPVTFAEYGSGRPVLLLHGGAGPFSVTGFAELLSSTKPTRVIVPIHPGFDGTPQPQQLRTVQSLAAVYARLLRDLDLSDVCLIGNSLGGWIAAELALAESGAPDRRVSSAVLIDAAGLQLDTAPMADYFSLTRDQVFDLAYFNPDAFRTDPASLPAERIAAMVANNATLRDYGGTAMADPSLLARLAAISIPTLVVWGAADRIVPSAHGQAYADAIPGAQFRLIARAGHLPQLEAPAELLAAVTEFAAAHTSEREKLAGVSVVLPGQGELALAGATQLMILEDGSTTSHRLGIAEITIAPHTDGPPQHRHARHDEGFYVVFGTAQFTVGQQTIPAPRGTLVMIPPGAPHTFANVSDETVVLLNTFTPDQYVQYFRDLRDMIRAGQPMSVQAVGAMMTRYATEPATTFAQPAD